jgi:hypothetical protein
MGAPPALLWAAKYPDEIAALFYIEAPVMLQSILEKIITFTPEAMVKGSMWWWVLPLATDLNGLGPRNSSGLQGWRRDPQGTSSLRDWPAPVASH